MRRVLGSGLAAAAVVVSLSAGVAARPKFDGWVVTASNAAANALLVYDANGALVQTVPTNGQGGVSGNAGGIAVDGRAVAVVNFGSQNVSIFTAGDTGVTFAQLVPASTSPVSVAFGGDHLYVLGTSTVESHRRHGQAVDLDSDGIVALVAGDGSAAQVGVTADGLIISEKSNIIETVGLKAGAVTGEALAVTIPPGSDTPFGLVTRGQNAYVTIAHSDEVSLIKSGAVVNIVATGILGGAGQHSPCWLTLVGPYLYSSNSPSHSITRFIATGSRIIIDELVAATLTGAPTDIASGGGRVAVLDGGGGERLTQFEIGDDGSLTPIVTTPTMAGANGVGIIEK
jgi:hypothetical protein